MRYGQYIFSSLNCIISYLDGGHLEFDCSNGFQSLIWILYQNEISNIQNIAKELSYAYVGLYYIFLSFKRIMSHLDGRHIGFDGSNNFKSLKYGQIWIPHPQKHIKRGITCLYVPTIQIFIIQPLNLVAILKNVKWQP